MTTFWNVDAIKDQVSLADLLSRLGHEPERRSGKELIYLSMLRDSDTHPSFCVNDELGVWFDHGMGKGGTVIDFGLAYWNQLSFKDVLEKIREVCNLQLDPTAPSHEVRKTSRPRLARKLPHYKVEEVKDLGSNSTITAYLQHRGIWSVAGNQLKELYYYVEDEKKLKKHFFSAAWPNENGGWEVRNKYFKGCLGHKGMSVIPGVEDRLVVFEGYFDFLSWKYENRDARDSVLVLNSLSFLPAAIDRANKFSEVTAFFDLDDSGISATARFLKEVPHASSSAELYQGYKDYNEKLMADLDALCRIVAEPRKDYFANIKVGFSR